MLRDDPARAVAMYAAAASTIALCALHRSGVLTDREMDQAKKAMESCLKGVQNDAKLTEVIGLYSQLLSSTSRPT